MVYFASTEQGRLGRKTRLMKAVGPPSVRAAASDQEGALVGFRRALKV